MSEAAAFALLPARIPFAPRPWRVVSERRRRGCQTKLRTGNNTGICDPCWATLHDGRFRGNDRQLTPRQKRALREAMLTHERPKDLVVYAEENTSGNPRSKLEVGFAMLAGEESRL
ncbi:MAG: hypothetical protein ACYTKD_32345 [Planctomycetota bacterium]|jgi:hypothetical protein